MPGVDPSDLAALPLLSGAPAAAVEPLAERLVPLTAAAGDVLVREGEEAHDFLVLRSGSAQVQRGGRDVGTVGPGDVVGELALLRRAPRSATVTATSEVTAWSGDDAAFAALLEVPGVADRLARTARQRLAGLVRPVRVGLRDGASVHLRPVLPGDRERAAESLAGFSPTTLHKRFLSGRKLTDAVVRYLTEVDYLHHFVWLALADGRAVADARLVREADDPGAAEIAFTVSDDWQGRGLGGALFGAVAVAAQELGVERFTARVLGDNAPMRRLIDRAAGGRARWTLDEPGVLATQHPVPEPEVFLPDAVAVARLREAVAMVAHATA